MYARIKYPKLLRHPSTLSSLATIDHVRFSKGLEHGRDRSLPQSSPGLHCRIDGLGLVQGTRFSKKRIVAGRNLPIPDGFNVLPNDGPLGPPAAAGVSNDSGLVRAILAPLSAIGDLQRQESGLVESPVIEC